jgi:hypothetical protein
MIYPKLTNWFPIQMLHNWTIRYSMSNILYTKFFCCAVPEVLFADHSWPNVAALLGQANGDVLTLAMMMCRHVLSTTRSCYSTSNVQYLRYSAYRKQVFADRMWLPLLPALHPFLPSLHLGEKFLRGADKNYYWIFYALASRTCRKSRNAGKKVIILGVFLIR